MRLYADSLVAYSANLLGEERQHPERTKEGPAKRGAFPFPLLQLLGQRFRNVLRPCRSNWLEGVVASPFVKLW